MFFRTIALTTVAAALVGLPSASAQTRRIALRDAVRTALRGDPSLEVADLQRRSALARATAARGAFAPRPFVETAYGASDVATASPTIDDNARYSDSTLRLAAGVGGTLPFGTTYALSITTSRVQSDAASIAVSPAYTSTAQLSVTQPLLRGAFGVSTEPVDVAELEAEAAEGSAAAAASDLALAVVVAYWQLATAQNAETVAGESVRLAEAQLEATRLRIRAGRLSPLDETSARASVAAQQDALVAARQARTTRAIALLSLLTPRSGRASEPAPDQLETADTPRPAASNEPAVAIPGEVARAREQRPELRALRRLAKAARRHADALDHDTLPDLSVTGTVGARGIAGDRLDPPFTCGPTRTEECPEMPAFLQGSFGQSYSNAADFPFFSIGARLEVPLPNSEANGRAEAAELDARTRTAQVRQAEWRVEVEVRSSARALEEARERLRTAEAALALAEESLQGEQRKFEAGVSTTFEVIRVQQSLAEARNARFAALSALEIARAQLARDTGRLLADLGVRNAIPVMR